MISAANITMRFGKAVLFEDVSVKFRPGHRYGLIGANGAGKTTFMRILTGQMEQTSGEVAIDQGCTLGYLRQDSHDFDGESILNTVYMGNQPLWKLHCERDDLYDKTELSSAEEDRIGVIEDEYGAAGGYTMEADAAKLLVGLGFPEDRHQDPMSTLTGGWRLRVLLAQVLFAQPDILLLDEPTNHLDMASIEWLVNMLIRYEGTVIVISHDRWFINQSCTHIADLDYHKVRMFTGNYDDFMLTNEVILEKMQRENKAKEKRANELRGFISRFRANASKARQATSRMKELSKLELDDMKPSSRISPYIRFEAAERLGDRVIDVEGIGQDFGDGPLFSDFTLNIANDEKIAIIGPNGVGKTTLLKILIGELQPTFGSVSRGETAKISYFPQDAMEMLQPGKSVLDWLAPFSRDEDTSETEIRAALGRMLFKGDDSLKPVEVLSGGERARLILSRMLMEGGNVLVLDEPTNHLDLEAIEALNYALTLVKETVIFVSHDKEFVNSLATRILAIDNGEIHNYPGNLDEYEAWKSKRDKKARKAAKAGA